MGIQNHEKKHVTFGRLDFFNRLLIICNILLAKYCPNCVCVFVIPKGKHIILSHTVDGRDPAPAGMYTL